MTRSLDLGCGAHPKNPFAADELFGVDLAGVVTNHIKIADLAIEPIPFPDEYFDYVTAYDVIEHIPRVVYAPGRRYSFVELMNEIYRVLKPGGVFFSQTPAFPHPEAWQDPTHVNVITFETFHKYFDDTFRWAAAYGYRGAFRIVGQEMHGPHLLARLEKVPAPT
ncbi:class I SAM-dependent methyltransferase [Azospirillum sp. YIM DDC1]|uniref:Class I SAM-dependent methyltransferase n=1 Tax=Azospirillum aestuarii TaxID=2802052 RepID=A0ABS1I8N6_9PROT|nr:class I SAM-dependent methyltransferase [Azospirillum aestuarii]MBK4723444.1 class I SAM-dependent methyltransferase [Azospirillum aestuarii]